MSPFRRKSAPPAGRRRRAFTLAVMALAGLAVLTTSTCGSEQGPVGLVGRALGQGASVQQLADGSAFLVAQRSNGNRMSAIVRGTSTVIGGGCVGFDEPGNGTVALVLPHGSRPASDGSAIEIPGGPTVEIGETVEGGGGYNDQAGAVASGWPQAPQACRSAGSLAGIYDVELVEG